MHIIFFIQTIQSRFLCRSLQTWRVIAANKNKNKDYLYSLILNKFLCDDCVYINFYVFVFIFVCHVLHVFAGRNKRMDRQNVHVNVLLMEGHFMMCGMFSWKKWDVLVSIGSLSEWLENAFGYCSNLRSCTDSNRNMLPARKNQDTFIIILDQSGVGLT